MGMNLVIADDATVLTERLALTPLTVGDADEMVRVLGDGRLHEFIAGRPDSLHELRDRYRKWIAGSVDPRVVWLNWVVRRRTDMVAVGTIQATVSTTPDGWSTAEMAWVVGTAWQGDGFASEAASSLIGWLCARGVDDFTAHIHPDNHASGIVAGRGGLHPTVERDDGETIWRSARSR
jgi:RimJ/RimL family protein N-acetyltransferase